MANSFQFNNIVIFDLIEAACNTLGTSAYATPFDRFDNNPYDGTSMRIVYPQQVSVEDGLVSTTTQNLVQRYRTIDLDAGYNAKVQVNSTENNFTDSVDSQKAFSEKYLKPAVRKMANRINTKTIEQMALYLTDTIGNPSSQLNGVTSMAAINSFRSNMGLTHFDKTYLQLSPNATGGLQVPYTAIFNPEFNSSILENDTTKFNKDYSGIMPYVDQNFYTVQNGSLNAVSSTVTVSVAPAQTDINLPYSTVVLTGLPASTNGLLLKGNRIYFTKGVTSVQIQQINQDTYKPFGNPKYFSILNDSVDSDGSGNATVNIFPPIVSQSETVNAYKNVNLPLAVGDRLNVLGAADATYTLNFFYTPPAIQFANPPISTMPGNSGMMGFGGFPFQQIIDEKIPNSEMSLRFNLVAVGDGDNFLNNLYVRSRAAAAAFHGFGGGIASIQ